MLFFQKKTHYILEFQYFLLYLQTNNSNKISKKIRWKIL